MALTIDLLRVLGSLHRPTTFPSNEDMLIELSQISAKNRMLFFYLDEIHGVLGLGKLSQLYEKEYQRYIRTNDAIVRSSRTLTNANIEYAVFKTIRPYRSTTVDLDILILKDENNYAKSVKEMKDAGYELIIRGPRSTTFWDKETDIGIDLYQQVAVGFITYMDKQTLTNHVTTTELQNGEYIKTLNPEADLACIIAHSIIKEQMYTLSEYYTFIYYLERIDIKNFLRIAKQNNIIRATRTHATITALLHKVAHKATPEKLQQMLSYLGEDGFEEARIIKNNFETPHKYHPITIVKSLTEITKSKETKKSIAVQLLRMLNPNISRDLLRKLVKHTLRKTY